MILSITTTHRPATDLGFLLHKHPARCQSFALSFGQAHVFYPEADESRCTASLLLDVDPVDLVRGRRARSLSQYVNDRPYVASSFLSVALARVYGTALGGRCKSRPELVGTAIPLEARLTSVPCHGGEALLQRLFAPLGYAVEAEPHPLDPVFPSWGCSPYYTVALRGERRLADLLTHLYVLVPVLDGEKHYWVGEDEVEKLLRKGAGWLETHPEKGLIADRYLKRRRPLVQQALARLVEDDADPELEDAVEETVEAQVGAARTDVAATPEKVSLGQQRYGAVLAALKASGAARVLDLGCGEGKLLRLLAEEPQFTEIVGVDVSYRSLERAKRRLRLERRSPDEPERVRLLHGSLLYRDGRLDGYDAAAVVEVVEHLDPPRLEAFERVVFAHGRPGTVALTTPNREYNAFFEGLPAGDVRHPDHRFEWTRAEFAAWAGGVGEQHGYDVRFLPIGPEDPERGAPTQMGVFTRRAEP